MKLDLYARKSTKDDSRSVDRQQRTWRADSAAEGFERGETFVDPDLSASRWARKDRPDYAALLARIASGESEGVWLWEGTRGSRQLGEWVTFLDLCRDHKVVIRVYGAGGDDAVTYRPWVQRDRNALVRMGTEAETEVSTLRDRTMGGNTNAAMMGRPAGPLLDGYRRVYGDPSDDSRSLSGAKLREVRQVVDEPRAVIYRAAAEGVLAGVPLQFMARVLNAWEVPTASGKGEWSGHGIRRALLNPGLQGHRVLGGTVVKRDAWPAIIDAETAARLEATLNTPGRRAHGDSSLKYMLSGALLCGACRRPMLGDKWRGQFRYECKRSGCSRVTGSMGTLDEAVSAIMVARLQQPDALAAFVPRTDGAAAAKVRTELTALKGRLKELEAEAAKPDGLPMELVASTARELEGGIRKATARLKVLETPPALRGFDPADLAARWDQYPVGERRAVVLGLAEVVLAPVGRGGRWSPLRLAGSRWHGDSKTWGEHWAELD